MAKPRMKLPPVTDTGCNARLSEFGTPSFSEFGTRSFLASTLPILASDLLLLARVAQRVCTDTGDSFINLLKRNDDMKRAPDARRSLPPGRQAGRLVQANQTFRDIVLLFRLAVGRDRKNPGAINRIIIAASGRKQTRYAKIIARIAIAYLCLVSPRVALAQETHVVTPIELFDPESGSGLRVAPSLVLYPQATAELTYDSNIYNMNSGETEDGIVSFKPSFLLRSDFSRHGFEVRSGAEIRRYFDTKGENSEQYVASAAGLLEFGEGINVEPMAEYRRGIEQRGTSGDIFFTDSPVVFHEKRGGLKISRTGRTLGITADANILKRDYADTSQGGVVMDLSFRDVVVRSGSLRGDLRLNSRTAVFAELSGNEVEYDTNTDPSRDSSGFSVLGGVHFELTSLVDIEAAVGYIKQNFDNPALKSVSDFDYRLAASWTPSPRWKISAAAQRSIDHSRTLDVPAIVQSDFRLAAERAVGRRLLVGVEGGFLKEHYQGTPRTDNRFFATASAQYRLAERIGVITAVRYRDQSGGTFGNSYNGFTATIGIRAAW